MLRDQTVDDLHLSLRRFGGRADKDDLRVADLLCGLVRADMGKVERRVAEHAHHHSVTVGRGMRRPDREAPCQQYRQQADDSKEYPSFHFLLLLVVSSAGIPRGPNPQIPALQLPMASDVLR